MITRNHSNSIQITGWHSSYKFNLLAEWLNKDTLCKGNICLHKLPNEFQNLCNCKDLNVDLHSKLKAKQCQYKVSRGFSSLFLGRILVFLTGLFFYFGYFSAVIIFSFVLWKLSTFFLFNLFKFIRN